MIDTQEALAQAVAALVARAPEFAPLLAASGPPPLRKRDPGFAGLAGIVVAQQVSVASARAIWGRMVAHYGRLGPEQVVAATDADLQACGLSRPKIRTLRAMAADVLAGRLRLDALHRMDAEEAHRHLVATTGIGPWTAEIYLLFCLGHPDAFPAGDLALQEAARAGLGLPARPSAARLAEMAEAWRPWRGAAAGILWACYAAARNGRDVIPVPMASDG